MTAIDAIREALRHHGWMSREDLAAATGYSASIIHRRTLQMSVRGEVERRPVSVAGGGRAWQYRLCNGCGEAHGDRIWRPRELDDALGGVTFPPPNLQHPAPRVRHRLFF